MSKHRPLNYGQPVPQDFLDALQEFIGTMASPNLVLSLASANQIQIVAGSGSAQVGLGIDGLWRYISAPTQTTVTGAAGTYDVFVTTGNNSFAVNPSPPPPETDSTNYAFALSTPLLQGNVPGAAHYRKVGEVIFDGTRVLNLRQTVGADGAQLHQPGDIKLSAAATLPAGWLKCDGSPVSRTTYAALYAALGGTASPWGQGDASTTFNLPDLRGRTPIGAGQGTAPDATSHPLASRSGEEAHTLSVAEMPVHAHGVSQSPHGHGISDPGHAHAGTTDTRLGGRVPYDTTGWSNLSAAGGTLHYAAGSNGGDVGTTDLPHAHNFGTDTRGTSIGVVPINANVSVQNNGSDGPHGNMPPFVACSYFIKT